MDQGDIASGRFRSTPDGPFTLYGTCYALLGLYYLGGPNTLSAAANDYITGFQDPATGYFIGPELRDYNPAPDVLHDREHLIMHLTAAVLPLLSTYGVRPHYSLSNARRFLNPHVLRQWLDSRNLSRAWFEGNNILFVGQFLVYLRDVEECRTATDALQIWFDWLEAHVDPNTSVWGTNGRCTLMEGIYGGYHQLLVYYYEGHRIKNPRGLIDSVLSLQHQDGGFSPKGNAGACEDVDCIDILVNLYKLTEYRRADTRLAIRRCIRHILDTQNSDGGFPYSINVPQSHMGVPGTGARGNISTTFPTWFRVHTLALCAEIVPDDLQFKGLKFNFNNSLSMGWHSSPKNWRLTISQRQLLAESWFSAVDSLAVGYRSARAFGGRLKRAFIARKRG